MNKPLALLLSIPTIYSIQFLHAEENIRLLCIDVDNEDYKEFIEIDKQEKKLITQLGNLDLKEDSMTFQGQDISDLRNVITYTLNRYTLELSFSIRNKTMGAGARALYDGKLNKPKESNLFKCKKMERQI